MDNTNLYQHFRLQERPFIDMINALIGQVEAEYRPLLTHFLDPRQLYIAQTLVQRNGEVKMQVFGGYPHAQRQRLLLYPAYYQPQEADFELAILEIKYPLKFATLQHSQIMGTLLNCGLQREVFGDIITDQTRWQFLVQANVVDYLLSEIQRIGKVKVSLVKVNQVIDEVKEDWIVEQVTVSSLRADALVAEMYHISRKHAKELFNANKIQLNWMILERADFELAVYDMLSVRGYGRLRLDALSGTSKKGKLKVTISILRK